jgi:hypothetical protein
LISQMSIPILESIKTKRFALRVYSVNCVKRTDNKLITNRKEAICQVETEKDHLAMDKAEAWVEEWAAAREDLVFAQIVVKR